MMDLRTKPARDRDKLRIAGSVLKIALVIAVFGCFEGLAVADENICKNGDIDPQYPYFLENESISLECIKYGSGPSDLKFIKSNSVVDEQYVRKINESAIKLELPPLTTEKLNEMKLSQHILCHDGDKCVKSIHVRIEYYPRLPKDIRCFGYNWHQVNCSWSLGVQYKDPNNTEVICEVAYDNNLDLQVDERRFPDLKWYKCPKLIDNTHCEWKGDDFKLKWRWYLRITVRNRRRNLSVSTDVKHFLFNEINQPAPVRSSKMFTMREHESCLRVKWRPNSTARNLMFNLTYTTDCGINETIMVRYKSPKKYARAKICGLQPYSIYTLTVSSRYLYNPRMQMGLWSPEAGISYRTEKKVPGKSPDTLEGLYDSIGDTDKNLTVYWKPLDRCDMHSDTVHYTITSELEQDEEEGTAFVSQLTIDKLPSYITIQAGNQIGKATNTSMIRVFPRSLGPSPSELIVEHNVEGSQKMMTLTINMTENNISKVLVWCKGSDFCLEPVQWMAVTQSEINMEVNEITRFGLITYSSHDNQTINTGIVWEKCSYKLGKSPSSPIMKPFNQKTQPKTGFRVDWSPIECSNKETGYVKYYELIYCKVHYQESKSCDDDEIRVEVSKQETSHTVMDLSDGSLYLVHLQAVGHRGLMQKSEPQIYTVVGKGKNWSLIALIVIGSAVGVILFICLIVFCCRRCSRRIKSVGQIADPLGDIFANQAITSSDVNSKLLDSTADTNTDTNYSSPDSGTSSLTSNTTVITCEKDPLLSNFDSDSAINMNTGINENQETVTATDVARQLDSDSDEKQRSTVAAGGLLNTSDNLLHSYNRPSDISCGSVSAVSDISLNIYDTVDEVNEDDTFGVEDEIETVFSEGIGVNDSKLERNVKSMEIDACDKISSDPESQNGEFSIPQIPQISQLKSVKDDFVKDEVTKEAVTVFLKENVSENDLISREDVRDIGENVLQEGFHEDGSQICDNNHTHLHIPEHLSTKLTSAHTSQPDLTVNRNSENISFPNSGSLSTHTHHKASHDQNVSSATENSSCDIHEDSNTAIPDINDQGESSQDISGFMNSNNLDGYAHNFSFDMDTISISDCDEVSVCDTVSIGEPIDAHVEDDVVEDDDHEQSDMTKHDSDENGVDNTQFEMPQERNDGVGSIEEGNSCSSEKDFNGKEMNDTKSDNVYDVIDNEKGDELRHEEDKNEANLLDKTAVELKNGIISSETDVNKPFKNQNRDKFMNGLRTMHVLHEPGSHSAGDYQMATVNSNSTIGSAAGSAGLDNPVPCNNPLV